MEEEFVYGKRVGDKYHYHYTRTLASNEIYTPPPEAHNQFEFLYVIEGKATSFIEGEEFPLQAGTLLAVPPYTFHSIRVDLSQPYERVCLHYDQSIIPNYCKDKEKLFEPLNTISFGRCFLPEVLKNTKIPSIVAELKSALSSSDPSDTKLVSCSIDMILSIKDIIPLTAKSNRQLNDYIKRAILYIGDHLSSPITLNDIANYVFLDKYYLCHLFKKELQMSPMDYIAKKRVLMAKAKIAEGDKRKEVFTSLGYSSYSSFYYSYKKNGESTVISSSDDQKKDRTHHNLTH